MAKENDGLSRYDDIDLDKDVNFITSDDPEIMEMEYDATIVMIGDIRKNNSDELYVVTALNEDISTEDDQYFYTIKPSGETSRNTSEVFLSNCKLIRRFENFKDAISSEEFSELD